MNQIDYNLDFETAQSPYAEQLKTGFRNLSFNSKLESDFRQAYNQENLVRIRFSGLSAFVLFIAFAILDYYTLPANISQWTLAIRFFFVIPALLITWGITYHPRFQSHMAPIVFSTSLIGGMGVVGVILAAHAQNFDLPYEGLILFTMYVYFLTGLLVRTSVVCSFLVFAAFIAVEIIAKIPALDLIYSGFFLFCANVIGAIGCYVMEYRHRNDYLHTMLLEEYAKRDGLTGIYNRRMFNILYERLWRQAFREKKSLAILLIDVDYFKLFNDHYGHPVGDQCLTAIASVINQNAKRPFDFAARYGGEEFAIVLYDAKAEFIAALAETICTEITKLAIPHSKSKVASHVTVSIGAVSVLPKDENEPGKSLIYADQKLYESKAAGRNQVSFEDLAV